MTIRIRLTLIFAVLMAVVLAGLALFVHLRMKATLDEAMLSSLRFRAQAILGEDRGGLSLPAPSHNQLNIHEDFAQLLSGGGDVLASTISGPPLLSTRDLAGLDSPRLFEGRYSIAGRTTLADLLAVPAGGTEILVVGESLEDRQEELGKLGKSLTVGGLLALAGTTLLGWVIAGAALRPVERMRSEASEISTREPGRRLSVPTSGDEIERLGNTLNLMLDRLEEGLERERRFVADASHELRTPIGILRTELELALRRSRSRDELELALRSAAEESDRLSRLAEDLLVLTRAHHGQLPIRPSRASVQAILDRTVRAFESRASRKTITISRIEVDGIEAELDPDRIEQALSNLLDNALRHTPPGGRISVVTSIEGDTLSITVSDTGEGFPEPFLGQAFEAFARADGGRGRSEGGTGLGLAIVRAIAKAHGGSVMASNTEAGGASIRLELPLYGPPM